MITEIKKRHRPDDLKNDIRGTKRNWARSIYVALLIGLAALLADFALGAHIFLRAEGLVIKEPTVVANLYPARIREVMIEPGEHIVQGQPILKLESVSLIQKLAEISTQIAELTNKIAQMKSEAKQVHSLLPLARGKAENADRVLKSVAKLQRRSLVTKARLDSAMQGRLESSMRMAELEARSSVLSEELQHVIDAQREATAALSALKALYNDGLVEAPTGGWVGPELPAVGDVGGIGIPLLRIYSGDTFVMAYIPDKYLFSLELGQAVRIRTGSDETVGYIERILPIAGTLPPEFQSHFKPIDRNRLIRVALPEDHTLTLLQKVQISKCWIKSCLL